MTTTSTLQRRESDNRLLIGLVAVIVLMAALASYGIGQLVLVVVTPHGLLYPHSLLTKLSADYHPWNKPSLIPVPPLNPQAAAAVEHDNRPVEGIRRGIVPAAILPLFNRQSAVAAAPTLAPTASPTPLPATTPMTITGT